MSQCRSTSYPTGWLIWDRLSTHFSQVIGSGSTSRSCGYPKTSYAPTTEALGAHLMRDAMSLYMLSLTWWLKLGGSCWPLASMTPVLMESRVARVIACCRYTLASRLGWLVGHSSSPVRVDGRILSCSC